MKEERVEYYRIYTQFIKEVIHSAPQSWAGGIITIYNDGKSPRCEHTNKNRTEKIDVNEKLLTLCKEFPVFKKYLYSNGWIKATIPYTLGDNSGDFSTKDGSFEYSDGFFAEDSTDTLPDESFWRDQTKNDAWQESPSLLVFEFIMDYGAWYKSSITQIEPQQFILSNDLNEKFCRIGYRIKLNYFDPIHTHDIALEWVNGVGTVGNNAIASTLFRDHKNAIEKVFDYELVREKSRWFLVSVTLRESNPI